MHRLIQLLHRMQQLLHSIPLQPILLRLMQLRYRLQQPLRRPSPCHQGNLNLRRQNHRQRSRQQHRSRTQIQFKSHNLSKREWNGGRPSSSSFRITRTCLPSPNLNHQCALLQLRIRHLCMHLNKSSRIATVEVINLMFVFFDWVCSKQPPS